jgi:hypothetical protein
MVRQMVLENRLTRQICLTNTKVPAASQHGFGDEVFAGDQPS